MQTCVFIGDACASRLFQKERRTCHTHFVQPESSKSLNSLVSIPAQTFTVEVYRSTHMLLALIREPNHSPVIHPNSLPLSLQSRENLLP
jgi:hypothetical protein